MVVLFEVLYKIATDIHAFSEMRMIIALIVFVRKVGKILRSDHIPDMGLLIENIQFLLVKTVTFFAKTIFTVNITGIFAIGAVIDGFQIVCWVSGGREQFSFLTGDFL